MFEKITTEELRNTAGKRVAADEFGEVLSRKISDEVTARKFKSLKGDLYDLLIAEYVNTYQDEAYRKELEKTIVARILRHGTLSLEQIQAISKILEDWIITPEEIAALMR